jgi:hypothetical protein
MKEFRNKDVIIDTSTTWIYIGKFIEEDENYYYLKDVDAFDISEVSLSKHEYLMMIKKDGLNPNRKNVKVLKSKVVAITLLEDIIEK